MTDDPVIHRRLERLLDPYQMRQEEDEPDYRLHAPVAGFQCAMLEAQIARYDQVIQRRRRWVELYDRLLGNPLRLAPEVPFRYQMIVDRDVMALADAMQAQDVMAWPLGSVMLHEVFGVEGAFPHAEYWRRRLLCFLSMKAWTSIRCIGSVRAIRNNCAYEDVARSQFWSICVCAAGGWALSSLVQVQPIGAWDRTL